MLEGILRSRYHGIMTKQTTVRLEEELAQQVDLIARAQNKSTNQLIVDVLTAEISRVRQDQDFMVSLKAHVKRDAEILNRLSK
jgi:predicted DNA-binding ribbon-helix-helix protein